MQFMREETFIMDLDVGWIKNKYKIYMKERLHCVRAKFGLVIEDFKTVDSIKTWWLS